MDANHFIKSGQSRILVIYTKCPVSSHTTENSSSKQWHREGRLSIVDERINFEVSSLTVHHLPSTKGLKPDTCLPAVA
jgi:hypothetical protein